MGLVIEGTIAPAGGKRVGRERGGETEGVAPHCTRCNRRTEVVCGLGGPSSQSHKWGLILLMEDK